VHATQCLCRTDDLLPFPPPLPHIIQCLWSVLLSVSFVFMWMCLSITYISTHGSDVLSARQATLVLHELIFCPFHPLLPISRQGRAFASHPSACSQSTTYMRRLLYRPLLKSKGSIRPPGSWSTMLNPCFFRRPQPIPQPPATGSGA
jgi:hypothetical protein